MKKTILFLMLLVASHYVSFACLNEEGEEEMMMQQIKKDRAIPYGHDFAADKKLNERKLERLLASWNKTHNYEAYNNYGVTLVYLGRFEEALRVFRQIEKEQPGKYSTAANMGTTYEVLGKNDSALYWIKRGVELNPASHDSSEWLHVKILEAKINGTSSFTSSYFTGVDFGTGILPQTKLNLDELNKLRDALYYQLNERVSFIKPKDAIVAQMLYELGNITAITHDAHTAYENYNMAFKYGYTGGLPAQRMARMKQAVDSGDVDLYAPADTASVVVTEPEQPQKAKHYTGIFVLVASVAGLLMLVLYTRRRK